MHKLKEFGRDLKAASDWALGRRPPIVDAQALAGFVDENAAFLVQKGIYEYSRARAGHYAKVMFTEQNFLDAVDRARWRAYPLGLAMVGELVEGVLRPFADGASDEQLEAVSALVLSVFDRYPLPAGFDEPAWSEARVRLARHMQCIGLLHAPKRAFEIADPFARAYFDVLPINKELRRSELPTIHSYLRVTLSNVHAELTRRADMPAVAASLRPAAGP